MSVRGRHTSASLTLATPVAIMCCYCVIIGDIFTDYLSLQCLTELPDVAFMYSLKPSHFAVLSTFVKNSFYGLLYCMLHAITAAESKLCPTITILQRKTSNTGNFSFWWYCALCKITGNIVLMGYSWLYLSWHNVYLKFAIQFVKLE